MKRYLRARLWFPGMDRMVERRAAGCLHCQAATPHKHRDPLKPTETPTVPWREVAVDHWGPTKEGKYLLVVVDYMSRYPEVEVVTGTSASANMIAFDNTRFYVIMIRKTMRETIPFYLVLGSFIISYLIWFHQL